MHVKKYVWHHGGESFAGSCCELMTFQRHIETYFAFAVIRSNIEIRQFNCNTRDRYNLFCMGMMARFQVYNNLIFNKNDQIFDWLVIVKNSISLCVYTYNKVRG